MSFPNDNSMYARVSSGGSAVSMTDRLIIVPPFEDPQKVERYRERLSHSISHHTSEGKSIPEMTEAEEADANVLERPVTDNNALPSFKEIFRSRESLGRFLTENLYFQLFVVFLVAVDSIIVIVVDLQLISHNECDSDSDCPTGERIEDHGHLVNCSVNANKTKCEYHHGHKQCLLESTHPGVDTVTILHYFGLAVLSLFVLEVLLRVFALGKSFFKKKLEIFDGVLVITSFIVYAAYRVEEPFHAAAQAVALLILLRVWRMKRIVNGITTHAEKRNTGKRRLLQEQLKVYQDRDKKLCTELISLKEEVRRFRYVAEVTESPGTFRVETSI